MHLNLTKFVPHACISFDVNTNYKGYEKVVLLLTTINNLQHLVKGHLHGNDTTHRCEK